MKLIDNITKNIMTQTITQAVEKVLDSRYIPEGYYVAQSETPTRVYFKEANGRFYSLGFFGRAVKPTFNYVWKTEEERQKHTDNFFAAKLKSEVRKAERKAEQRAKVEQGHLLEVGDIMVCNWGYDQTNIDYYQVTKLIGKTMVELRPISAKVVDTSGTYEKLVPVKDNFITSGYRSKTLRKRVNPVSNSVGIYSFANAYLWNGKPDSQTMFGFGH